MKIREFFTLTVLFCALIALAATASAKEVRIITDSWAPYYDTNLKNQGFFCHIVSKAFKKAGHQPIFAFVSWKRAEEMAKNGEINEIIKSYGL